jgi:hypothetical protein
MVLLVFPIMFLSIAGFLHDPIHLTQSFLLIIFTLLFFLFIKEFNWIKNRIFIAPILIPVSFLISAIINGQNIDTLLIGAYQRNFGLLTTLALVILFILCASPALNIRKFIDLGLLLKIQYQMCHHLMLVLFYIFPYNILYICFIFCL